MTIELNAIMRVRLVSEAAFGTDETGSLGGYVDVPFRENTVTWTTDREMLDPMTGKQRTDAADFKIPGQRRGTLSMTHNLAATGVIAADTVIQVQSALGLMLKIGMGGEQLGTGTTVATGASASEYTVAGVSIIGNAEARARDSDGNLELRVPKSIAPTILHMAYSDTPASPEVIFGAATYFLTQNPAESAQFILEGAEASDGWLMIGAQLDSMTIDTTLGQIPTITLNWKCAGYLMASETTGSIGGATAATITNYSPIVAEGEFMVRRHADGVTRPAPTCISSITINFGLTYNEVPCPSGVNGIKQWRRVRSIPVASLSYQTFYEDEEAWTDRDAKLARAVLWQMGVAAGGIVAIEWVNCQVGPVQRVDANSFASEDIPLEAFEDSETAAVTDIALSAVRIHFA